MLKARVYRVPSALNYETEAAKQALALRPVWVHGPLVRGALCVLGLGMLRDPADRPSYLRCGDPESRAAWSAYLRETWAAISELASGPDPHPIPKEGEREWKGIYLLLQDILGCLALRIAREEEVLQRDGWDWMITLSLHILRRIDAVRGEGWGGRGVGRWVETALSVIARAGEYATEAHWSDVRTILRRIRPIDGVVDAWMVCFCLCSFLPSSSPSPPLTCPFPAEHGGAIGRGDATKGVRYGRSVEGSESVPSPVPHALPPGLPLHRDPPEDPCRWPRDGDGYESDGILLLLHGHDGIDLPLSPGPHVQVGG
jgi:hypothetical protein